MRSVNGGEWGALSSKSLSTSTQLLYHAGTQIRKDIPRRIPARTNLKESINSITFQIFHCLSDAKETGKEKLIVMYIQDHNL